MTNEEKRVQDMANRIMIDTMDFRVGVAEVKLPKKFGSISADPAALHEPSWAKGNLPSASGKHRPLRVHSEHKSGATTLIVEGSNSMQYVGHNIVSSNNAVMTAFSMLDAVRRQYPLEVKYAGQAKAFRRGETIKVTRIDTPAMLKLPQGVSGGAIVNAIAFSGLRAGHVTTVFPNETVYLNQHSQLAALKAYLKHLEVTWKAREKRIAKTENTAALLALASDTVRFEAVFRLKYLQRRFKDKVVTPAMLSPKTLAGMFLELLDGYDLNGSMRQALGSEELLVIRPPYRSTVALWQRGVELEMLFKGDEKRLASQRRVIKNDYKIDIFLPPPGAIEVPIELGEILRVENFVPVPAAIKSDPALFYERDMQAEWVDRKRAQGQGGVSWQYVDPYHDDEEEGGECDD